MLLNPHFLSLLQSEKGLGRKLQMKYDGPFEILQKYSPVTYRLHLLSSYSMHPILNVSHLEAYHRSDLTFGERRHKHLNRADITEIPEYEV